MKFAPVRLAAATLFILFVSISIVRAGEISASPPDSIGPAGLPTGQIAFIRDGNIWVMDVNGTNQRVVCRVHNAEGRLSWSPDNRQIVFTRAGLIDLKGPDLVGDRHKVYDLFVCSLDSAEAKNIIYTRRLTNTLGSRGPQWTTDDRKILFWQDMNAGKVDSRVPNYQICTYDTQSNSVELLRDEWQSNEQLFLVTPSINSLGQIAFVFFDELQPGGLVVLQSSDISISLDLIKQVAGENAGFVAPAWSSDDNWLALVGNYPDDSGLYISTSDLQTKYLVTLPPDNTQISKHPPSFSPDSKWLTFATTDGSVWICSITGDEVKRLTKPGQDQAPCWSR